MEKLATIDELTGALTRRAFMEKANARLTELREQGALISIALLDIDKFKSVNDSFGHAAGDRLLARVSAVVSAHLRQGDLFGRLGGEEFAVLFARAGQHDAVAMTNALRIAVERSAADGVGCTLSAGVGGVTGADTLESAMVRADAALYVAKAAGRNRVIESSEDDESASPRIAEPRQA
jgi:diguanylate cyclase (GGDEF)-like protein